MERTAGGLPGLGEVAWGSHYCHFYDNDTDLADTLVPYFTAGLDNDEACMWVTADPLRAKDARTALSQYVPDLAEREARGQIEIVDFEDWYRQGGATDAHATLQGWLDREERVLAAGYRGLRLTGNTFWLEREDWGSFVDYEALVNEAFRPRRVLALCSYCAGSCSSHDVFDVLRNHQLAFCRRDDSFEVVESGGLKVAREDVMRLQSLDGEHRALVETLRDANRRKDDFLAMLGHELRNPLAPIVTALQLMDLKGEPAFPRERETISRQVRHLKTLVDDLLDISRISRGKVVLQKERVAVKDLITRSIELASPVLEEKRHALVVDLPAVSLAVEGDRQRLTQVLANLLTNAGKYTPPGGRIEVGARREGGSVCLRVADNGEGMEPLLAAQAFDFFVQGQQSVARSQGGLGLGLAIVKNLVELHEGRVELDSELGQGTEVRVWLSVVDGATAGSDPHAASPLSAAAAENRVLVVDDNVDAAGMLVEILSILGCRARAAHDGPSALVVAAEFAPTLAVLDIGLPVMDGYELAERLRQTEGLEDLRLVALSGYGAEADRARSAEIGFDHHLVKPVDSVALVELLDE